MKKYLAMMITILLTACGAKLDGTYKDDMGVSTYTFKSGKVTVLTMGVGSELDYHVDDGKVKITSPQGTVVMNILPDGSIEGPMGIRLMKQKE